MVTNAKGCLPGQSLIFPTIVCPEQSSREESRETMAANNRSLGHCIRMGGGGKKAYKPQ